MKVLKFVALSLIISIRLIAGNSARPYFLNLIKEPKYVLNKLTESNVLSAHEVLAIKCNSQNDSGILVIINNASKTTENIYEIQRSCQFSKIFKSNNDKTFLLVEKKTNVALTLFKYETGPQESKFNQIVSKEIQDISSIHNVTTSPDLRRVVYLDSHLKLKVLDKMYNQVNTIDMQGYVEFTLLKFINNTDLVYFEDGAKPSLRRFSTETLKAEPVSIYDLPKNSKSGLKVKNFLFFEKKIYAHINYEIGNRNFFSHLYEIDLANGKSKKIIDFKFISNLIGLENNRIFFQNSNERDFTSTIESYDLSNSSITKLFDLRYESDNIVKAKEGLYFIGKTFESFYEEIYFKSIGGSEQRITWFSSGELNNIPTPTLTRIEFTSNKGKKVVGYVSNMDNLKSRPLIVSIRGGPGVWRPDAGVFGVHSIQLMYYFEKLGYSILLLNPLGWGNEVEDITKKYGPAWPFESVSELDQLISLLMDSGFKIGKIGIVGQSAGSLFANWATMYSKNITAAVSVASEYDTLNSMFICYFPDVGCSKSGTLRAVFSEEGDSFPLIGPKDLDVDYLSNEQKKEIEEAWNNNEVFRLKNAEFSLLNPISNVEKFKNKSFLIVGTENDSGSTNPTWAKYFYEKINLYKSKSSSHEIYIYLGENHTLKNSKNIEDYLENISRFFKLTLDGF